MAFFFFQQNTNHVAAAVLARNDTAQLPATKIHSTFTLSAGEEAKDLKVISHQFIQEVTWRKDLAKTSRSSASANMRVISPQETDSGLSPSMWLGMEGSISSSEE